MNDPVTVLIILALVLAVSVGLVMFALGQWKEGAFARRLKRVAGLAPKDLTPTGKRKVESLSLRRDQKDSGIPFLDNLIRTLLPHPEKLRERLQRTGKKISLGEYLLASLVAGVAGFFLAKAAFGFSLVMSLITAVIIGVGLPHKIVMGMIEKRLKKFLESFPEAIDTICRGLRSGLPVTESIAAVGREMPDPIGVEFRRIADAIRVGLSQEDAMWEVAKRLDNPEFRFLIIAMAIQKETGGNLAETLGNLAELLRRRRQMRLKVKAMSSEAKASAMIIGSLPFFMLGILMLVNSDYVMTLFSDPRGHVLLGVAAGMMGIGVFVMQRMVKFDI